MAHAVTIDTQPQPIIVSAGDTAVLTVGASGGGPLSYQWRRNGFAIAGETAASFSLTNASRSDTDLYDVQVAEGNETVTSDAVWLSVRPMSYPGVVRFESENALMVENAKANTEVWDLALTPDGKIIVVGQFIGVDGRKRTGVVRFNADSSVDETFVPPSMDDAWILSAVVQPDGKVLLQGFIHEIDGETSSNLSLVRLNSNGSIDTGFHAAPPTSTQISAIAVQADGKIWLGAAYGRIDRLNADGSVDTSFSSVSFPDSNSGDSARALTPLEDGSLLVALDTVRRLNPDGTIDTDFAPVLEPSRRAAVHALVRQPNGEIVIGGEFSSVGGETRNRLARLNADGSLDETFVPGIGLTSIPTDLALQPDGKLLVVNGNTNGVGFAARFNADGSLDSSFAQPDIRGSANQINTIRVNAVVVRPDGSVVFGGGFTTVNGEERSRLAVLDSTGGLEPELTDVIRGPGSIAALTAGREGSFYVGGTFTHLAGLSRNGMARVKSDGSVDPDFDPQITGTADLGFLTDTVSAVLVQGDGKILAGGLFNRVGDEARQNLVRLNVDGSIDATFAPVAFGASQTRVLSLAQSSARRILVGGYFTTVNDEPHQTLVRLNEAGTVDPDFANGITFGGGVIQVHALNARSDGSVYVAGSFSEIAETSRRSIARLTAAGSLDAGFVPVLSNSGEIRSLVVEPDGDVVLVQNNPVRLHADGSPDSLFDYFANNLSEIRSVLRQEDGKLWLGGKFAGTAEAPLAARLQRIDELGALDPDFAFDPGSSRFSSVNALLLTDVGELWAGGSETGGGGLVRLKTVEAPIFSIQPVGAALSAGGALTLDAKTAGGVNVSYQWYLNGEAIIGATTSRYAVASAQAGDAGDYQLVVTHRDGTEMSDIASVTVAPSAPVFAPYLSRIIGTWSTIKQGTRADLTAPVPAAGSAPLSYQWYRDGEAIVGETGRVFSLPMWQVEDAGLYQVRIANSLGEAISDPFRRPVSDEADWQWRMPQPQGNFLGTVHHLGGRFVATGLMGTVMVSTDGITWDLHRLGGSSGITALSYGNGRYLGIGESNSVWTSVDAVTWVLQNPQALGNAHLLSIGQTSLIFADGAFVAVGQRGLVARSTDGQDWQVSFAPTEKNLYSIAFNGERYLAMTTEGDAFVSSDGSTWSTTTSVPATGTTSMAFGAGRFVVTSSEGLYSSVDGTLWTKRIPFESRTTQGLQFSAAGFLAPAYGFQAGFSGYYISTDGETWTEREFPSEAVRSSMTYADGRFVTVGGPPATIATSLDGLEWTPLGPTRNTSFNAIAAGSSSLVAVGSGGAIWSSTDGSVWVERTSGVGVDLYDIAHANGVFVIVGANGTVLTSTNGESWTLREAPISETLLGIDFTNDRFIATGSSGRVMISLDGATWSVINTSVFLSANSAAYGNGVYVVAFGGSGSSGLILTSADGETWTTQSVPGVGGQLSVTFGGGAFVLVSLGGDIARSIDGQTWTLQENPLDGVAISNLRKLRKVEYRGGRFIAYTDFSNPDLITSPDGLEWKPAHIGYASRLGGAAEFDGEVFIVGDYTAILSLPIGAEVPMIVTAPVAGEVTSGGELLLTVATSGSGPLRYQWIKDGAILPDETRSTLTVGLQGEVDAGDYAVRVSNQWGTVTTRAATVVVKPPVAPLLLTEPRTLTVTAGGRADFLVRANGTLPLAFQWFKDDAPVSGETGASLSRPVVGGQDAGFYSVRVSNAAGWVKSEAVELRVLPAGVFATQVPERITYRAGDTVRIVNTFSYTGEPTNLSWQVLLPEGWSLAASDSDDTATTKPVPGTSDLAEWTWSGLAEGPLAFSYVLHAPSPTAGLGEIASLVSVQRDGVALEFLAKPDPIQLRSHHSADTNGDSRLSLSELLRVIELYNTRFGSVRTGRYRASNDSVDGFASDGAFAGDAPLDLVRHHVADVDHDGKLSLGELLRVIELYNTRAGSVRTGAYHPLAGTSDGFGPGE